MFTLASQGPLPAWYRLSEPRQCLGTAPRSASCRPLASPAGLSHPRHHHPPQILFTDPPHRLYWCLLSPAGTWQDTLTQSMLLSSRGKVRAGQALAVHSWVGLGSFLVYKLG